MSIQTKNKNYDEFVEKFKPKLTTDDCYTPPAVYEVIKEWVVNEYNLQGRKIVRPFYPGGDYKNFDYSDNAVVIDNPPFSILAEIKDFYCKNDIPFFLFAPGLTLFSSEAKVDVTYIIINTTIIYHNGAKVKTAFVTNLDDCKIYITQELGDLISKIQNSNKTKKENVKNYPPNVISAATLFKYCKSVKKLKISKEQCHFVRRLDHQKQYKKTIFV